MASCEICNKEFADEQALAQHNAAKHHIQEKKPNKINSRKVRNWTILIIIFLLIVLGLGFGIASYVKERNKCKTAPAEEINIGGHTNINLHKHGDLEIIINGQKQLIPTNIGVGPGVEPEYMRPLHTHDASGEIHIEGLCPRNFRIGDFFNVWGKQFNSQCILDACINESTNATLKFYVNDQENGLFQDYIMKDDDKMRIEFIL